VINEKVFGGMSPSKMEQMIDELAAGKLVKELSMKKQVNEQTL